MGANRNGGAVELVRQEAVTTGKCLGRRASCIGEGDGLLVDDQFFEGEGHVRKPLKVESREWAVPMRRDSIFSPAGEKIGATGFEPATS